MNIDQLILAFGTILLLARVLGWAFQKIGQPRVIGEMTAGILLGPSVFGRFFPDAFHYVLPSSSFPAITVLSQLGLLLFMFVVGLEVDLTHIAKQRATVVLVSNVSILLPLALGIGLARSLYPQFAGKNVSFPPFALFIGTAMSVTAFPVLARILKERNLTGSRLGTLAIACAAIDDISAWLLLAVLTAMVRAGSSWKQFGITLLFLVAFVCFMLIVVRRLGSILESWYEKRGAGVEFISFLVLFIFATSWTTEKLGVHALFGAFMAGLVMPKNDRLLTDLVHRIESLSLALLLPLFFALTGLRTRVDLLTGRSALVYGVAIIAIAVAGKLTGAASAAMITGVNWKDSLALGVLMNTRGLVELVILNAALDLGVSSTELFTMMVLMALVTTFMTSPILSAMRIGGAVRDINAAAVEA
ncbi:MAG TPA: cation:proton antiporter [Terriglobales bacterium]|nr:cation:proton antiporter [Terriglobales bacterium]